MLAIRPKLFLHSVSRDPATGTTALKPVVALNVPHASPIAAVTLETPWGGPSAPERIETTDGHPWRTLDGRWVPTAELKPGQLLWRETGRPARMVGVEETGRSAVVYNMEVADWHTYFVGNDKVWVHNASKAGLQRQLDAHRAKLNAYKANPAAYDNKGFYR